LAKVERPPDLFDFGDESRNLPQGWVVRAIGPPRSKLIVAHHTKAEVGKIEKWLEVLGVSTGATVQEEERSCPFACAFVPDASAHNIDVALFAGFPD
jgi:hypothetical protein